MPDPVIKKTFKIEESKSQKVSVSGVDIAINNLSSDASVNDIAMIE